MSKTALFNAAKGWDAAAVAALLEQTPPLIAARDGSGRSALHVCARRQWDGKPATARAAIATARALIKAGEDVNVIHPIPDDGEVFPATPLWCAVAWGRNPPLVKALLKEGANPDHCLAAVVWANDVPLARVLLKAGSNTGLCFGGETPLHYAARLAREPVLLELVRAGADIHVKDSKGRTPLDYARKKRLSPKVRAALGESP
jgi:ankyrin repeat protein